MVKGGSALNSLRLTTGERLFNILNIALLALLGICTLYPFLYELTISLSPPEEAVQSGWHLFPDHPTLQAYAQILKRSEIHTAYLITIARTVAGTALALMLTSIERLTSAAVAAAGAPRPGARGPPPPPPPPPPGPSHAPTKASALRFALCALRSALFKKLLKKPLTPAATATHCRR